MKNGGFAVLVVAGVMGFISMKIYGDYKTAMGEVIDLTAENKLLSDENRRLKKAYQKVREGK